MGSEIRIALEALRSRVHCLVFGDASANVGDLD
jgi:hypothetical protein